MILNQLLVCEISDPPFIITWAYHWQQNSNPALVISGKSNPFKKEGGTDYDFITKI